MVSNALFGASLTAALAAAIGATLLIAYRKAQARLVRVPVRARRTRR